MAEIEATQATADEVVLEKTVVSDDGWRAYEQMPVVRGGGKRSYLPMGEDAKVKPTETKEDRPHVTSGKMTRFLRGPRG